MFSPLQPKEINMGRWLRGLKPVLSSLHFDESGQDLIEYALLAALIALAAIAGMQFVARMINQGFSSIGNVLSSAIP
jgi:pilus assembly protein Flp/PilA